jgi:hypothetical protein
MEYIHELFDRINELPTLTERKEELAKHINRPAVRALLKLAYDKSVDVMLPDSEPPYKPSDLAEGLTETRLDNEARRFDVFIRGWGYDNLRQTKRESLFIGILEGLHAREAKIMVECFQHKYRLKGMTTPDINEVFGWDIPYRSRKKENVE